MSEKSDLLPQIDICRTKWLLTARALHLQGPEIFPFLGKTVILTSKCGFGSEDPTTAVPLSPTAVSSLPWEFWVLLSRKAEHPSLNPSQVLNRSNIYFLWVRALSPSPDTATRWNRHSIHGAATLPWQQQHNFSQIYRAHRIKEQLKKSCWWSKAFENGSRAGDFHTRESFQVTLVWSWHLFTFKGL